jgi:hypothetical protein
MSIINISDAISFINDKNFEKIKQSSNEIDLYIKENSDLFLLANVNENLQFKNQGKVNQGEVNQEEVNQGEVNQEEVNQGEVNQGKVNQGEVNQGEVNQGEVNQGEVNQEFVNIKNLKYQANGIIFEKVSNKVVAMCQPKLLEMNNQMDVLSIIEGYPSSDIRMEFCEDGTMMRLYNYKGEWFTATTRCIDARVSYWSSDKSFDEMFWDIFDKNLLYNLDPRYTYIFILMHKDNRNVVKSNTDYLVYISRINNVTNEEDYINHFKNVYNIKRPRFIDTNEYLNTIKSNQIFDNRYKRGVLLKIRDHYNKKWVVYKYDFENYKNIKTIRGNVPQIRMRYLELLNKPETLQIFEKIYSENHFMFTFIKVSILKLVKTIYKLYIDSHIKHIVKIEQDDIYYRTLRQLHAQYKTTNKPITFLDVQQKIYSLDKNVVKKLLQWQ